MAQEARQLTAGSAWHNHLPPWIRHHEIFAVNSRRNQTSRAVLQVIANSCDPPDAGGNLMFAIGGRKLAAKAGVQLRTFWRHVARLEEAGLIVTLSRGGQLGNRNIANTYGVPGSPGSLDHRRARRRDQIMKLDGTTEHGRPRYVPEIVVPGHQATLYPDPDLQQQVHQRRPHVGEALPAPPPAGQQKRPQPPSKHEVVTLPPCPRDTTPVSQSHASITIDQRAGPGSHGSATTGRRDGARSPKVKPNAFGGPCIQHIPDEAFLRDTGRMRQRYATERRRGAVRMSEENWLAVAEKAMRVVRNDGKGSAVRMFAAIVNREEFAFVDSLGVAHLPVAEVDEQRARARLQSASSDDHRLVQTALDLQRKRRGVDAFRLVQEMRPGKWPRERFDAIVEDLRQAGLEP